MSNNIGKKIEEFSNKRKESFAAKKTLADKAWIKYEAVDKELTKAINNPTNYDDSEFLTLKIRHKSAHENWLKLSGDAGFEFQLEMDIRRQAFKIIEAQYE